MEIAPKIKVGISLLCLAILAIGCESKFSESSPSSVEIKGKTLKERLAEKDKIDSRIDEVQRGAEKVKTIIEMFKKIQPADNHQVVDASGKILAAETYVNGNLMSQKEFEELFGTKNPAGSVQNNTLVQSLN